MILHHKRSNQITSVDLVSMTLGVALYSLVGAHSTRIIGKRLVDFSEEKNPTIPAILYLRELLKIVLQK
ncbi:hypothetical protein ES692_04680 [Psychroserpens burtonensis]|uniref:Uncharacterized protein n=2 Tax=Psychroserpens burtonensis TaxID=49278 RepID=A0A5C7BHM2_9FLAO|nr:hypothetical protein [Psychroserpens burtonensis]TXE19153.1 hypothetical protein ES692_04680 [Psychroserpens burtonensis]